MVRHGGTVPKPCRPDSGNCSNETIGGFSARKYKGEMPSGQLPSIRIRTRTRASAKHGTPLPLPVLLLNEQRPRALCSGALADRWEGGRRKSVFGLERLILKSRKCLAILGYLGYNARERQASGSSFTGRNQGGAFFATPFRGDGTVRLQSGFESRHLHIDRLRYVGGGLSIPRFSDRGLLEETRK